MTTLEESSVMNVIEDKNLAPKEAQRKKKRPGKNPLKEKLVRPKVASKTNEEMKKSVEILSENVDVVKDKRGKGGMTMKGDDQKTEVATPVASQVAEVSSPVAAKAKRKKENPKKTQLGSEVQENASQPITEDKQEETSGIQVPAKKGRGKKPKDPVKEKAPAVEADGVSQPKAAEVKKGQGKAKVIVIGEVEKKVSAAENSKKMEAVKQNSLQETEPAPVVIAKKSRPGRPAKAATVENIEASQVPKAVPAKKVRGKKVMAKPVEDGAETAEEDPNQKAAEVCYPNLFQYLQLTLFCVFYRQKMRWSQAPRGRNCPRSLKERRCYRNQLLLKMKMKRRLNLPRPLQNVVKRPLRKRRRVAKRQQVSFIDNYFNLLPGSNSFF